MVKATDSTQHRPQWKLQCIASPCALSLGWVDRNRKSFSLSIVSPRLLLEEYGQLIKPHVMRILSCFKSLLSAEIHYVQQTKKLYTQKIAPKVTFETITAKYLSMTRVYKNALNQHSIHVRIQKLNSDDTKCCMYFSKKQAHYDI